MKPLTNSEYEKLVWDKFNFDLTDLAQVSALHSELLISTDNTNIDLIKIH